MVANGKVFASHHPTAGPSAWSTTGLQEPSLGLISCPTATFCALGDGRGNLLTSARPTRGRAGWTRTHIPHETHVRELTAISCASPRLCVAVDHKGREIIGARSPAGAAHPGRVALATRVSHA
jgi:hypothetical protein